MLGAVDARNGGIEYFPTNNRTGRKNKSAIEFGAPEKFVFANAPEFDSFDFENKCKSYLVFYLIIYSAVLSFKNSIPFHAQFNLRC